MRNDVCFPCLEHPQRCFLVSVFASSEPPKKATPPPHALLSCNRKGELGVSAQAPKPTEEWCLVAEDPDSGIVKLVNAAHNSVLTCNYHGQLQASPSTEDTMDADAAFWTIEHEEEEEGRVRIRSFAGNCYLSCTTGGKNGLLIQTTPKANCPTTLWKLEYLTGELCYIQLAGRTKDKLLLCDNLGHLKLSSTWGGWEIWRFIEAGNNQVRISSWTHQHKLLMCDDYGKISTTEDRWDPHTLWTVRLAPRGLDGVAIVSALTGRLLRSDGSSLTSTGYIDGVATTWQLSAAHRQKYYLSSIGYDKRISLLKDNVLKTTHHKRDCEVWCLEKVEGAPFVLIRSQKFQTLLRYDGQGLSVTSSKQDLTTKWRIVESPTGNGVCIVSAVEPFLALSCNSKGELEAVDHQGPFESWSLEPSMPFSLEGWQINLMIGGAVGAAVLGPAVAMGVLGCVGAESAAVTAAAGASAVAAEAAVAGELVTTSGAVAATAAGLSLAGTTAAIGTGAAVGLSATGIVVATSRRNSAEGTDLRQADQDRPFCEWRSW